MSTVGRNSVPWYENRPGSRIRIIADSAEHWQRSVLGMSLLEQEVDPGIETPSHTHDYEEILTVVAGEAEVWLDEDHWVIGPGDSLFIPTGSVHGFRNSGTGTLVIRGVMAGLELDAHFLEAVSDPSRESAGRARLLAGGD